MFKKICLLEIQYLFLSNQNMAKKFLVRRINIIGLEVWKLRSAFRAFQFHSHPFDQAARVVIMPAGRHHASFQL
jgi:hypothetical protein